MFGQYIPLLGSVENEILTCFRDGGLGYESFPRLHDVMEENGAQAVLGAHILPLVPGLVDRLERGIRVIDVGGRGRALKRPRRLVPQQHVRRLRPLRRGDRLRRDTAAARSLDNVAFHVTDAARLAEVEPRGGADLVVTFDAVHDQADPEATVRGIRHALAGDGVSLARDLDATSSHHGDLDHLAGPVLCTISCLHCMTVSLACGGAGYGAMWGRERAQALFARAGFDEVEVHTLDHDPQNAYLVEE